MGHERSDSELVRGVQHAYDRHAEQFAAATAAMPDAVALLATQLLADLQHRAPLLDAGCGPGRDMAWFEAHGLIVVGADRSPGLLAEARRRVRGPLVRTDLRALALGDAQFAAVWCNAALLHLPSRLLPVALRELRRVVQTRGLVAITLQLGQGEGWEAGPFGDRYFARYQADEVAAQLQRAGLGVRVQREWPSGTRRWLHLLCDVSVPTT